MNSYENITELELREMVLNGTIDTNLMGLDEYEKLFGYEIDRDEPDETILDFCCNGLKNYEPYCKEVVLPPFDEFLKKYGF